VTIKVSTPDFAEAGPDTTICEGSSVQLYASGGVSYKWEPATGLSDRKTATPDASPHKTITYRVTVTNEQGLEDTAEVTVTVNPLPELKITNEYKLCEGDSIRLNAEGEGEFHWEPEEGLSRNDVPDPLVWPSNTTNYTVRLTNQHQCTNTAKTTVKVYQKPRAYAGSDQTLDYQFEATLNARQPLTGTGKWSVLKGKGTFAGKSDPNTRVTNLVKGENTFLWKVDNGICPVSEDRVSITVKDLFVPTIITPNNDGKNDRFRIPGLKNVECQEFILFNRWGNEIYKEKNYKGDWNGINKWGEKVTPDTYYYILKLKSGRVLKGHLDIEH
jgi:gliding motility-associated-like protein